MIWSKVLSLRLMTPDFDFNAISIHFSAVSPATKEDRRVIKDRIASCNRIFGWNAQRNFDGKDEISIDVVVSRFGYDHPLISWHFISSHHVP